MEKWKSYDAVFRGWEQKGIITEVTDDKDDGHYLPHRPVFRESLTTPVRPVFDASCKTGRNPSLNDCLFKGPNLLELIPALLLRFREYDIGATADIRKAFQMIRVRDDDQKFQKFLWWTDESCSKLKVYQHQRVVFGMNCSPFLLAATIQFHLQNAAPEMMEAIPFYVDNLVNSVKTDEDYASLKTKAIAIMAEAGMELREWARTVGENGNEEDAAEPVLSLLGLLWNRRGDTLSCVIPEIENEEKFSKKKVLSLVARFFDPIGMFAPALVPLKSLIQDSWAAEHGWDEVLPEDFQKRILKWIKSSSLLKDVRVPRHFQYSKFTRRECHVFVDASCIAYAGVIFIRTELMGAVNVQLVLAKSRLAPRKKSKGNSSSPTIPRLELMACVIGTRLVSTVRATLGIEEEAEHFWSDSTTALAWIRRNDQWGTFVGNRVEEIRKIANGGKWRHVPGLLNPADLPSRGCDPKELLESSWWKGPTWLKDEKSTWPSFDGEVEEEIVMKELMKTAVMIAVPVTSPHFSSYRQNVAARGGIVRFCNNARGLQTVRKKVAEESGNSIRRFVSIPEMRLGEKLLLKVVQEESFPVAQKRLGGMMVIQDECGLLRVQTRLTNRKDKEDFIFPVVLPRKHPMVDLLIQDVHRFHGHAGIQFCVAKLREKYWILSTRRTVGRVIRECTVCRRYQSKPCEVIPAALPEGRVMECEPFQTTGVDLFGPLYLKDGSKVWGIIFTCAYFRGVYLDLVSSLTTESFLMALERFLSIYGRPNTLYSDNGTNFHGAVNVFKLLDWKDIEKKSNLRQIQWIFNPPSGAWWGGFWERLIRSVKDLLKRIIGTSRLDYEELRTCLAGVSATINDRPLTVVTEDGDDLQALTPSMFLKRNTESVMPETADAPFLQKSYLRMKALQQQLQERFRKEYLSLLVQRGNMPKRELVSEGAVVLVGDSDKKRFQWPLGIVLKLIPGRDGIARVARIKTAKGILERPVQRLYPMEVELQDIGAFQESHRRKVKEPSKAKAKTVTKEKTSTQRVVVTKRGRVIRTPARYGAWLHLIKN